MTMTITRQTITKNRYNLPQSERAHLGQLQQAGSHSDTAADSTITNTTCTQTDAIVCPRNFRLHDLWYHHTATPSAPSSSKPSPLSHHRIYFPSDRYRKLWKSEVVDGCPPSVCTLSYYSIRNITRVSLQSPNLNILKYVYHRNHHHH